MTNPPNDSKVRGFLLRFIAMAQEDADARMLTRYGEQQIDNFINQAVIAELNSPRPKADRE